MSTAGSRVTLHIDTTRKCGVGALWGLGFCHFEDFRLPIRWVSRAVGLWQLAPKALWLPLSVTVGSSFGTAGLALPTVLQCVVQAITGRCIGACLVGSDATFASSLRLRWV